MSHISIRDVQKLLGLDVSYPYVETWEEQFELQIDGIQVHAVVTHEWRRETVKILRPFEVSGNAHGIGFEPMLVAIGAAFLARNKSIAKNGLSLPEYWEEQVRLLYRLHRDHPIDSTNFNR